MKHLTPYRQNETSLSPVRGRGMVLVSTFLLYQLVQFLNEICRRKVRNVREFVMSAVIRYNVIAVGSFGTLIYPFHRSMICAKCSSCAISSSVMFTIPRNLLNSAGTCLLPTGSSIDSVIKVTTICFSSRVIPCNSAMYGAIGVSLILCANVDIIVIFLFSGARTVQAESNQVHLNCRGVARSRILRLQRYKEKSNNQRIRIK